jgi:hypothetical protein
MNDNAVKMADLNLGQCLLMLLLNSIPFFHTLLVILLFFYPWERVWVRCLSGVGCLYLLPPMTARVIGLIMPIKRTRIAMGSREYFTWWALANLQMVFCRLPFLEELLRLIPGVYSNWLRLWGAKIGRLTYWAAGTKILDRQCLQVGNNVVFGAGVRINAHVLVKNETGQLELLLAPIKIGDNVIVGGYSLLTTGTEIADGEFTRALLSSPPFSHWQNGTRSKKETDVEL